jgi:hypothetical protein
VDTRPGKERRGCDGVLRHVLAREDERGKKKGAQWGGGECGARPAPKQGRAGADRWAPTTVLVAAV